MRTNEEITELIRERLKSSSMSMSELADKAGVSKSTLSRYLSYSRELPLNKAMDFARVLNITTEELFGIGNNTVNGDNHGLAAMSGDINGNVSFGSTIQKEDLHEVASNLNLTDRELQEKTFQEVNNLTAEVKELKQSQTRLENTIALLVENQVNILSKMRSVDDSFNDIVDKLKDK